VIEVAPGRVDELAGELLGTIAEDRLVALGGGRVVDVAKALAAASGGAQRAMAIPTTLSGAEMTRGHRQAAGAPAGTGNVRPAVVINDPLLSASQPEPEMAASALNALGHAAEGPCTPRANPVSTLAALEAARLIVGAWPRHGGPGPRRARAGRAAGRLHDRLDALRPAPRALADARAARRDQPRGGQRDHAAAHARRARVALPGLDRAARRGDGRATRPSSPRGCARAPARRGSRSWA
jgi:hypothetical protein